MGGWNNNSNSYYKNNNDNAVPHKVYIVNEEDYVKHADEIMKNLIRREKEKNLKDEKKLTTSKIRNILAMFSDIYNEVMFDLESTELSANSKSKINYMTIRLAYECGREKAVDSFNKQSDLLENIKRIGKNKENFILVFHYMEALVAYHRFYGGKDN